MVNEQLRNYIQSQLDRGVSRDAITQALLGADWPVESVTEAMNTFTTPSPVTPTIKNTTPTANTTTPIDMFAESGTANPSSSAPSNQSVLMQMERPGFMTNPSDATNRSSNSTALAPNMMQSAKASASIFPKGMKPKMVNGLSNRTQLIGLIIGITVAVGLIAGGVYAYMNLANSSTRVSATALNNLSNLQSASFAMTIVPQMQQGKTVKNPVTNKSVNELTLQISGQVSGLTTATPSQTAVVIAKLSGSGGADTYQAEVRSVNNTLYTKFGELSGAPAITTSVLQNQWFSLTSQSISAVNSAGISNIDGRIVKQFSATELTQLKNGLRDSGMVSIGKKEGVETIQNTETIKYPLTLNATGTKQFLQTITPVLTARGMTTAQIQTLQKNAESTGDITGSIWISKKDQQLYQVQLALPAGGTMGIERIVVGITLWDHNTDVKIEIPSPVKPLDTALLDAQRASQSAATIPAVNTTNTNATTPTNTENDDLLFQNEPDTESTSDTIDSDELEAEINNEDIADEAAEDIDDSTVPTADSDDDGLTNAEETRYKTDPLNDDSDDDGFLDGEEVENGFNPSGEGKL